MPYAIPLAIVGLLESLWVTGLNPDSRAIAKQFGLLQAANREIAGESLDESAEQVA